MHFRCAHCRALTEAPVTPASTAPVAVACGSCGRRYRISVRRPEPPPEAEKYRKARQYAEARGIDLASAYSVLEGIMTLEDAALASAAPGATHGAAGAGHAPPPAPVPPPGTTTQRLKTVGDLQGQAPHDQVLHDQAVHGQTPRTAQRAAPASSGDVEYDPGFAAAVRDKCLSPLQAVERGERKALAMRMSQRHRLPMELALQVADNRITVHQALLQKAAQERREVPRPQTSISHGIWNFMVLSMGALILFGLGVRVFHEWEEYLTANAQAAQAPRIVLPRTQATSGTAPGAPAAMLPPPPLTVPKTDAVGQVIEVTGPDPSSVLVAFCQTGRNAGRRQPVAVAATAPPSGSARLGLYRNLDQPESPLRAIRIRKDPKSNRWWVGDGHNPILTEPPPAHLEGSQMTLIGAVPTEMLQQAPGPAPAPAVAPGVAPSGEAPAPGR